MAWQYKRVEGEFAPLKEGDYRIRIAEAEKQVSKAGNDMLMLKLDVSGTGAKLWHYITFLNDRPEVTNRMLTQLFDSFGIEEGNFKLSTYIGKVGACRVKHDDDGKARIHYLISQKKQKEMNLPPWREPGEPKMKPSEYEGFNEEVDDDEEIPF